MTLTKDFEWPDLKIEGTDSKRCDNNCKKFVGLSRNCLCREEENKGELKLAKEKRKEGMRDEEKKYRPHVPPFFGL